jgi:hypothetical protein
VITTRAGLANLVARVVPRARAQLTVPSAARPEPLSLRRRGAPLPRMESSAKLHLVVAALAGDGLAWCARPRRAQLQARGA